MRKIYFASVIIILSSLAIIVVNSCKHSDIISGKDLRTVYFDKEILPIFITQCDGSGCHGGNNKRRDFTTYKGIKTDITPGQPYNSKIYTTIIGVYLNSMPPGKPISENQRTLIKVWIEQGADSTAAPIECDTTHYGFSAQIVPILNANCISCHNENNANGYTKLDKYESITTAVNSGELLKVLKNKLMPPPPNSPLSGCKATIIEKWIKAGALNN